MHNEVVEVHDLRAYQERKSSHYVQQERGERRARLVVSVQFEFVNDSLEVSKRRQEQIDGHKDGHSDHEHHGVDYVESARIYRLQNLVVLYVQQER